MISVFNVTNLNDAGEGSLRNAICLANKVLKSIISINITGTIKITSNLPEIRSNVAIQNNVQTSGPILCINFNGNSGLKICSDNCKISNISFTNSKDYGICIERNNCLITDCYFGINLQKNIKPNDVGILIIGNNNIIGQNDSLDELYFSNIISGNINAGIYIKKSNNNFILNNLIGNDGMIQIPNKYGIIIYKSKDNVIGGKLFVNNNKQENNPTGSEGSVTPTFVRPLLGNIISGNLSDGVVVYKSASNSFHGNFVGTNYNGTQKISNGGNGIFLSESSYINIQGCTIVTNPFIFYNVISGNLLNGVEVYNCNYTTIQGNFIGLSSHNDSALSNGKNGLLIGGNSNFIECGQVIPLGNVISGNGENGIHVKDKAKNLTSFNTFGGIFAFGDACPNGKNGIEISSSEGPHTLRTNVLSGNVENGICLSGNSNNVQITSNILGEDTHEQTAIPNGKNGLLIKDNSHNNNIGYVIQSVINTGLFSGNMEYGIVLADNANNNIITNSNVGLGPGSTLPRPNNKGGILLCGQANNNTIGQVDNDNFIGSNIGYGITIEKGCKNNTISENWISVGKAQLPIPNTEGAINNQSNLFDNVVFNNNFP